jgi:aldehyde:ferredoxin oxidoreductase
MKEKIFVRSLACYGCPIGCRKVSQVKSGPYACTVEGPEFESICLLGANCGVGDLEPLAYAAHLCDELGMDTISTWRGDRICHGPLRERNNFES